MASKYLQKYPVPEDFPDLLHDFAREVLRDQPENIYEYGALYFKAIYMVSRLNLSNPIFVTYREYHLTTTLKASKSHQARIVFQTCPSIKRFSQVPMHIWFRMRHKVNTKWPRKSINNNNICNNMLTNKWNRKTMNKMNRMNKMSRINWEILKSNSTPVNTSMN